MHESFPNIRVGNEHVAVVYKSTIFMGERKNQNTDIL